ncbi:hypothetical protein [Desulfobulbus sp.]|uniref:hypothetical protein n=1 Tax=Desulfobulbus sp. TaxID=895 RepID=UPI0027BB1150|nr:hypothetical protein [Desulfobulbus sp.]
MNITIVVSGQTEVAKALAAFPGKAHRACAVALNKTGKLIKEAEVAEMKAVFDNPTSYTLNSLKLTPATKDNLQATVGFKEPARYGDNPHYLFPQVEGGPRHLKGFEQGVSLGELTPALGAKLNRYGNVSFGQIRQILSVLGKAETAAGYNSNITDRSRRRNTKERDYVVIDSRQRGNLPLGVYQRFQTGVGFGAKTKRSFLDRSKSYQKGRTRGRFASVIRARGLRPVLLVGHTGRQVKPLLDFYGVAQRTFKQRFDPLFRDTLNAFLKS